MLRVLVAVFVVGGAASCGGTSEPAPRPPNSSTAMQRPVTPRAQLPAGLQPLLPKHGIYAGGAGDVSPPWRVVVDLDAKTLTAANGSTTSTKPLSPRNEQFLMEKAFAAWTEPAPSDEPASVADYEEVLIVLQGDDTFFLQRKGAIRRPKAAEAIVELRAAAGL